MKPVAFVVFLLACSNDSRSSPPPSPKLTTPEPAPALKPAPTSKWSYSNLQLAAGKDLHYDARVALFMAHGNLEIGPANLPIGTIIQIGEHRFETKSEHGNNWKLKMDREIADSPWTAVKPQGKYLLPPKIDWKLPIVVTLPGREPLRTQLQEQTFTTGLDRVFIELATTPRAWPDDKPTSPVPAAAAWTFVSFDAIGDAEKVRDVRMVAVATVIDNDRTRRCTGYAGAKDFTATSYDVELAIVDRITKEKLATKTFAGQPSCPKTVMVQGGEAAHHAGPSHKPMLAWVKSQLAPLAKKLGG